MVANRPASKAVPPKRRGNFADVELLLEHLCNQPIIELGKPLPSDKHLPKRKCDGLTPAQINRLLLDLRHSDGDHGSR